MIHMKKHEKVTCEICKKDVSKDEEEDHAKMHKNYDLFGKALKKGKVTKEKKKVKVSAYNIFVKTQYAVVLS